MRPYITNEELCERQRQLGRNFLPRQVQFSELQEVDAQTLRPKYSLDPQAGDVLHQDIRKFLQSLVDKISHGQALAPLLVSENFTILDGHHRYFAGRQAGVEHFPVIVVRRMP